MELWETIKDKATDLGRSAVKESNRMVETVKGNFSVSEAEAVARKLKLELGELVYAAYQNQEELPADTAIEKCKEIDAKIAEAVVLKEELAKLKNQKKCENCGNITSRTYDFCPKCGHSL